MKTLTTFLTGALMLANITTHARIIRVNSVAAFATTCTDCYQTLDSGYNAAIDGDTIHLEPADANYGDLTIQKRLVIIGAGYNLGAAPNNSGLQANSQTSTVNALTVDGVNSGGTEILGLRFFDYGGGLNISNTSHITVRRSFFDGVSIYFPAYGTVSDIVIAENFISGGITHSYGGQTITHLTIRNNIINGQLDLADVNDVIADLLIMNNTLLYNGNHPIKNSEVAYNSFYAGNITDTNSSNTIHHNISEQTLPLGTNNTNNVMVSMGSEYNLGVGTYDSKYDIRSTSLYDEGGAQGRGAFSGISPYKLSGIPNIPTIYSLQSTLNTTPGGTVNVTLSTKSNN